MDKEKTGEYIRNLRKKKGWTQMQLAEQLHISDKAVSKWERVIFMRRYWFADSYKDIAEFVGLSEKNISVRLTRIRQKMKSYLAEREVFV